MFELHRSIKIVLWTNSLGVNLMSIYRFDELGEVEE